MCAIYKLRVILLYNLRPTIPQIGSLILIVCQLLVMNFCVFYLYHKLGTFTKTFSVDLPSVRIRGVEGCRTYPYPSCRRRQYSVCGSSSHLTPPPPSHALHAALGPKGLMLLRKGCATTCYARKPFNNAVILSSSRCHPPPPSKPKCPELAGADCHVRSCKAFKK